MLVIELAVAAAVVAVLVMNAITTRRLWASAAFERRQKIAQTAMIWLLPPSCVVVWLLLYERRSDDGDPTVGKLSSWEDTREGGGHQSHGHQPGYYGD
jgi:hypothetical protein